MSSDPSTAKITRLHAASAPRAPVLMPRPAGAPPAPKTALPAASVPPPSAKAPAIPSPRAKGPQVPVPIAKPASVPAPLRAAPPPANPAVPPPVAVSHARPRHWLVAISFLITVVLPAIVTAIYLWGVAVDQYASRMGFSVRQEETSNALEMLSGLANISGSSSSDTDILFEFIQSQQMVRQIDAELDLRALWSRPESDWVFALDADAPIEDLTDYWNDMVTLSYGAGSGLLDVEVRAFSAADAQTIAQAVFDRSLALVNELSAVAREDTISYARADLDDALERLKTARETVTLFRNENQIIDPESDLAVQASLLGNLQSQRAETLIEIDLLRDSVPDGDPRLAQAQRRLEVIEARIAAERQRVGISTGGDGTDRALADVVGEYERLVVDREFAEAAYVSALGAYDAALAEARRNTRYLAAYLRPTLAETPEFPQRGTLFFLVTLFLVLGWSIAVLVGYSVKDRR